MTEGAGDARARVAAITGATSGIGRAAAEELGRRGARLLLLVRDAARGEAVADDVHRLAPGVERPAVVACDLASLGSVVRAAARIEQLTDRLDALINNAGLIAPRRILTEDGLELTFQVNHLSHFLLTRLLEPLLAAAGGRVVTVSSDAHRVAWRGIDFDDLTFERRFTPFGAYAVSKLANIMFAYAYARRAEPLGITSNALHPGMVRTGFGRDGWGVWGLLWDRLAPKVSPSEGADTVVYLALEPGLAGTTGRYFYRRRPVRSSTASYDVEAQERLWEVSEALVAAAGIRL